MENEIYELEYIFIEHVRINMYCKEIMDLSKNKSRPYLFVKVKVGSKHYLLPFRTSIKHEYCYKLPNTSNGIDFTKSIPLINSKILKRKTTTVPKEYGEFLKNGYNDICTQFTRYLKTHNKLPFSTNHDGLVEAQKTF